MRTFDRAVLFMVLLGGVLGCGVKGDPIPPASPAEIGRGKPLFKGTDDDSTTMPRRKDPKEQDDEEESDQ